MAGFAADLRGCAAGAPVGARRPGLLLRARRWVQRHPVQAVSVALASVALGLLIALLLHERTARARSEREATRTQAALQFLEDLFYEADPQHARGDKTPVGVLLERGRRRLRDELAGGPELRAALLNTLGSAAANVGLCRDAEPLLREALALAPAEPRAAAELRAVLTTRERLAQVLGDQERHAEAEAEHRALVAAHAAAGNAAAAALARVGVAGALWRQDRVADAQREYDAALEELAHLLPPDDLRLLRARRDRAAFLRVRVDAAAALAELRVVHERLAATLPADDATLLQTTALLASAEVDQDRPRDAEERLRRALAVAVDALDAEHPLLAALRVELALALHNLGQGREALGHLQAALATYRATHGDDHPLVARTRHHESHIAFDAGDLPLAAEAARHALAVYEQTAPGGSHDFAMLLGNLARVETLLGRPAQARTLARRSLAMHDDLAGARTHRSALTLSFLAYADALLNDLPAAKTHAREACALAAQGGNARTRFLAATYLTDILLLDEEVDEAAAVLARAREEHEHLGSVAGQATLLALSGWLHHLRDEHDAAERDLLAALAEQERYGADHPYRARTLAYLGAVHVAQKRYADAIARLQAALVIRRGAGTDLYALYPLFQLARAHLAAGDDVAAWECGRELLAILRRQEAPHNRMVRPALQLLTGVAAQAKDPGVRNERVAALVEAVRALLPERDGMRQLVERLAR
jgi:serine/threonine-protein kinase